MIEGILIGLTTALTFQNIFMVMIGCFFGTIIGMLPGLGPMTAIALMIPITYGFDPATGLILILKKINFVNYPDDSFDNMIKFSKDNNFNFPYLHDDTQEIAKSYDAVCTPDFFGYNKNLELQYRGRLRELKNFVPVKDGESDLLKSMKQIAETGNGPQNQIPSAGCGIKWKYD